MDSEKDPLFHHEIEEQDNHHDERWLVSYADMMTLLFGLFVLLYSMAHMDPETSEKIKTSAEKQFGVSEEEAVIIQPDEKLQEELVPMSRYKELLNSLHAKDDQIDTLILSLEELKETNAALEKENSQLGKVPKIQVIQKDNSKKLKDDLRAAQKQILILQADLEEASRDYQNDDLKRQILILEKQLKEKSSDKDKFSRLISQLSSMRKEKDKMAASVRRLSKANKGLQIDLKSMESETRSKDIELNRIQSAYKTLQEKQKQLIGKTKQFALQKKSQTEDLNNQVKNLERSLASTQTLENELNELKAQLASLSKDKQDLQLKYVELNSKLSKEIDKNKANQTKQAFMAFTINWSTRDHDIDLTIEDPNGQKFDFKKRSFQGHPGLFALDTRRGPGVELWQTERIIPGKYKATYYFFNQYGNISSAKISGTIFTPKGSFEIPLVEMDLSKNRKFEVVFEVEKDGQVNLKP